MKLLDFGISKFEPEGPPGSTMEPTLTAHGTTLGTPEYMSPEQIEGLPDVDARADVWAMATVLYEMLAGEAAVNVAGDHVLVMQHILRKDIAPLTTRADWVSPPLGAVIDAGLVRDRDRRIKDASTFVKRLLDVFPDAGSRPSMGHVAHATDITELGPPDSDAAPSTTSDPRVAAAAMRPPATDPAARLAGFGPSIADTANPASAEPPSSSEEGVLVFNRETMKREMEAQRAKKKQG